MGKISLSPRNRRTNPAGKTMGKTRLVLTAGACILLASGCVVRRFTIDSYPQGATVYRDGKPIGVTPVDDPFIYYGTYRFTLVKDGFETQHVDQKVPTPWHSWPGLDFFTENLWPFEVKDQRRFTYTLQPKQAVNENDALNRAEMLRARGRSLQTSPGAGGETPPPLPGTIPPAGGPTLPPVGGAPGTVPLPPITSGSDGASR